MQLNSGTINSSTINGVSGAEIPIPVDPNEIHFVEEFGVDSNIHSFLGVTFVENPNVDSYITSKGTFIFDVIGRINVKEKHSFAMLISFAEAINFTGEAVLDRYLAASFVESVILADSSASKHIAIFAIAEALTNTDDLSSGFAVDFLNAIGIDENHDFKFNAVVSILESLSVVSSTVFQARLFFIAEEGISVIDDLASKGNLSAIFEEGITVGGLINTPEGLFEAWTVNTESGAPYQYTNFPFNSFAMINGTYYGADESGLFSLEGSTDDGTNIEASIKSGLINLGTTLFKRIPRAYFGYTSDGILLFNTITTESGQKIERWYEFKEKTAEETTNTRVKLARGVKSVYWQFEIINVDGADFDFDSIKLMPAILKRRR